MPDCYRLYYSFTLWLDLYFFYSVLFVCALLGLAGYSTSVLRAGTFFHSFYSVNIHFHKEVMLFLAQCIQTLSYALYTMVREEKNGRRLQLRFFFCTYSYCMKWMRLIRGWHFGGCCNPDTFVRRKTILNKQTFSFVLSFFLFSFEWKGVSASRNQDSFINLSGILLANRI